MFEAGSLLAQGAEFGGLEHRDLRRGVSSLMLIVSGRNSRRALRRP
jgi:hypothetical protein